MSMFLATFAIMIVVVTAMAVGVILGGRRIAGTCGGLNNIEGLENACSICSKPCAKRQKALEQAQAAEDRS